MAEDEYSREELELIINSFELEIQTCSDPKERVVLIDKQNKYIKLLGRLDAAEGTGVFAEKPVELNFPDERPDYSQPLDVELEVAGFDSNNTSYGRPGKELGGIFQSPTPQGMSSELAKAKAQVKYGSHATLNIYDALSTIGYSESEMAAFQKSYLNDNPAPVKKPQKKQNNPVKQPYNQVNQNPLKRTWD